MSQACLLYLESCAVNAFTHQAGGPAFSGLSSDVVQDLHCVTEQSNACFLLCFISKYCRKSLTPTFWKLSLCLEVMTL